MKKFLMFDVLITPWIIRISYWFLQLCIILIGVSYLFSGSKINFSNLINYLGGFSNSFPTKMSWWIFIIVCSICLRLILELFIVLFKISENSSQIKYLVKNNPLGEEVPNQQGKEFSHEEKNEDQVE